MELVTNAKGFWSHLIWKFAKRLTKDVDNEDDVGQKSHHWKLITEKVLILAELSRYLETSKTSLGPTVTCTSWAWTSLDRVGLGWSSVALFRPP